MSGRKLSDARQTKLDRIHVRDCPYRGNIESDCEQCRDIDARAEARVQRSLRAALGSSWTDHTPDRGPQ